PHASLFLKRDLDADQVSTLARRIESRDGVTHVRIITPAQGLQEFQQLSGFHKALAMLQSNPLPPVIEVEPSGALTPAQVDALVGELGTLPNVEQVRLDQDWLRRLHAIMKLL